MQKKNPTLRLQITLSFSYLQIRNPNVLLLKGIMWFLIIKLRLFYFFRNIIIFWAFQILPLEVIFTMLHFHNFGL